jgi:hypothetical protein
MFTDYGHENTTRAYIRKINKVFILFIILERSEDPDSRRRQRNLPW